MGYTYYKTDNIQPSETLNLKQTGRPLGRHIDAYAFDDLLVACTQEIIINGFETDKIPATVKDWIAGMIVRSLPKKLSVELLNFILDKREQAILFRCTENEFTILLNEKNSHEN